MTYVGAKPTTGDFKLLDSITTSSTTTFNLRQGGVAVYPQSANHCLVVLNGVLQTAGSSFNIVNDTIVFASSLSSSDVINQILVLGNVNDIGVPSDSTVTDAKIVDMAASKLTGTVAQSNIAEQAINEAKMQISNAPTNGYFLSAQSGNTGGLTWAEAPSGGFVRVGGHSHGTSDADVNTVTLDNIMTSTYKVYKMIGKFETTTDAYLTIGARTGGASGSTYSGSNKYRQAHFGHYINTSSSSGTVHGGDYGAGLIYPHGTTELSDGDDDHSVFLDLTFWKDANRSYWISHTVTMNADKTRIYNFQNAGWLNDSNTYTGFIFQFSSGDLDQCTVDVYGMVNS